MVRLLLSSIFGIIRRKQQILCRSAQLAPGMLNYLVSEKYDYINIDNDKKTLLKSVEIYNIMIAIQGSMNNSKTNQCNVKLMQSVS